MTTNYAMDLIGFIVDAVFVFLYLKKAGNDPTLPVWRKILSLVVLLLTYLLYSPLAKSIGRYSFIRYLIRTSMYFVSLMLFSSIKPSLAFYDAAYVTGICTVVHNVLLAPVFDPLLRANATLLGNRTADFIISVFWVASLAVSRNSLTC